MKEYNSEEEFLKDYNSDEFEKLSMTSDILIVSVSSEDTNNYRKTDKKMMSILLAKRDDYPYKGKWCLPGGFLDPSTETLEDCARRVLKNEYKEIYNFIFVLQTDKYYSSSALVSSSGGGFAAPT